MSLYNRTLNLYLSCLSVHHQPAANPTLRRIAAENMPARLWREVYDFLEPLRRRLPNSLPYMQNAIYTTHIMLGLFHEQVPALQAEWRKYLDNLGDYAR